METGEEERDMKTWSVLGPKDQVLEGPFLKNGSSQEEAQPGGLTTDWHSQKPAGCTASSRGQPQLQILGVLYSNFFGHLILIHLATQFDYF